jgi:RHS repeat-associated protein
MGNDASQTISLPKGGGALHGIGEKFSADLFTGTANFSVPIEVPSGRNGFHPQLALGYSSGTGNGPFGLGWSLSVPGVARKTSKGLPRYDDTRDVFILSGAEDLVPVESGPNFTRYQPRTEGLFARITHHFGAGENYWKVESKDGLTNIYGAAGSTAGPATIVDPAHTDNIFAWKLSKTTDTFGNVIEYRYVQDEAQLYVSEIRYVDYGSPSGSQFLVSVRFSYEPRQDEFSDHRAGFPIRTRRRCSAITVVTKPAEELVSRTYSLIYAGDPRASQSEVPLNGTSLLTQIQVTGIDGLKQQLLPPLKFDYTRFVPKTQRFFPVTGPELPAESLAHSDRELVSLFGNGLLDILQMNGVVRYWRNLGNGTFDRPRAMANAPGGVELADSGVQLLDANGDGRADLLVSDENLSGYYSLNFDGTWNTRSFQKYKFAPSFNLKDPEVRLIDLDGDGITDAVRSGSRMECFFQDAKDGWREAIQVERKRLEDFPDVNFSDPRIKLADMSGDGLQDIVMVHDGRIDYWPALGRGKWGRRVTMSNSPKLPTDYDPRRVLVGDVDGDGAADIVYVSDRSIKLWINQSGNGWSNPIEILGTPPISDQDSVRLIDLLGTGVSGILWSRDVSPSTRPMFFLDFTNRVKPYLLSHIDNNIGAITQVHYSSSTEFYLKDQRQPATRWKTPLPFPVQVVARVEVLDSFSENKLTTEYSYHHGYWDGEEREFRGFGRVDQRDTESVDQPGGEPFAQPTETRAWFHQGAVEDGVGDWKATDFRSEFWSGDVQALQQLDPVPDFLKSLTRPVRRDALRVLRGSVLRTEIYALDGSDRQSQPYTVTEQIYGLRKEFPPQPDTTRQSIFFRFAVGQRTTQWERGDEPMTQFAFTANYDAFGQPRSQVAIAVPRGRDFRTALPAATADQMFLITQSKTDRAHPIDASRYIVDRVAQATNYEIRQQSPTPGSTASLDLYSLLPLILSGQIAGKVLDHTIHFYDGDAFTGLSYGQVDKHGTLVRSEQLVLTDEVLSAAYGTLPSGVPPYFSKGGSTAWTAEYPQEFRKLFPASAGYIYHPGGDPNTPYQKGYYTVSDSSRYDFQASANGEGRGLMLGRLDALGHESSVAYDSPYSFLPVQVKDAAGMITKAEYDYRLLLPRNITDANGNRGVVTYTPLGLPATIAMIGKATETVGDTEAIPGTICTYNFSSLPISVRTEKRVYHVNDANVDPAVKDQTIATIEYSDGFGRVVQTRSTGQGLRFGDPVFGGGVVPADQSDPNSQSPVVGQVNSDPQNPNVIVSGWQFYDNKGQVTRKFEPFFSVGWQYSAPTQAQLGQSSSMFYDPRGHVVRTVNPDGSEQRVVHGVPGTIARPDLTNPDIFEPTPWESYAYDANDNAGRTHADESTAYKQHWNTPASSLVDALGRSIRNVVRNGSNPATDWFAVTSTYDIRGNVLETRDMLGRVVIQTVYDLGNRPLRTVSLDSGEKVVVMDAAANQIESRDSKGSLSLNSYDILNRAIRVWARDNSTSSVTLRQRMVYGDHQDSGLPSPQALNLLGRLFRHYDEAGLSTNERFDFKGNGLESVRQVVKDSEILSLLKSDPSGQSFQLDWEPAPSTDLATIAAQKLDPTIYRTSTTFDALNRPRTLLYPVNDTNQKDKQPPKRSQLRLRYNRAGALEQVELEGSVYVKHIAYNAKGQRTLIAYGNGVLTRYAYDALTFRLLRLRSERYTSPAAGSYQPAGPALQDCGYTYDLIGNVLQIMDRTPGCGVLNNPDAALVRDPILANLLIKGDALIRRFSYDPIYRLLSGSGRECSNIPSPRPWSDDPRCGGFGSGKAAAPDQDNAPSLTSIYQENYEYDPVGNILALKHAGKSSTWVRSFGIGGLTPQQWAAEWPTHLGSQVWANPLNNRLTHVGDNQSAPPQTHSYDVCGNLTSETTSRLFDWDHSNRLRAFRVQPPRGAASVQAYYLYDAAGQRVKKLVVKQDGSVESTVYVSGIFEHRSWGNGSATENIRLHVMDNQQRIAMVRVGPADPLDQSPEVQFHLGDHLGSSSLVIDNTGGWINREEYTPYGETIFGSFGRKRYRFTGKERDEESGLYYHGARYYAPWVARWVSCDPAGTVDGLNLFVMCRNNPIKYFDKNGNESGSYDPAAFGDQLVGYINVAEDFYLMEDTGLGSSLWNTAVATIAEVARGTTSILKVGTGAAAGVEQIQNAEDGWDVAIGASRILSDAGEVASTALGVAATGTKVVQVAKTAKLSREIKILEAERELAHGDAATQISKKLGEKNAQKAFTKAGYTEVDTRPLSKEGQPKVQGVDQGYYSEKPFASRADTVVEAKGRAKLRTDPTKHLDTDVNGLTEGSGAFNKDRLRAAAQSGNKETEAMLKRLKGRAPESYLSVTDTAPQGATELYRLKGAKGVPKATKVVGALPNVSPAGVMSGTSQLSDMAHHQQR